MTNKELFLECAEEAGIKVADYAMTRVTDYMQAVNFFNALWINNVQLGMDMASLTCSGDVKIEGVPQRHICLVEKDNGSNDYFKFKKMIVMNGELRNPDSAPEIFIEADTDIEWLQAYSRDGFQYLGEGRYLGLEIGPEGMFVYDEKSVNEYLDLEEESYYDPEIVAPPMRRIIRNTNREMLVYVNVQGCHKRHKGNSIIYRARNRTCDDIIKVFSKQYREI